LIEKARGSGTFRTQAGSEHPVAYTLEVRQELVDGLPGTIELEGFVTFADGVTAKDLASGALELKDGRTTEVVLQLGEAPAGEVSKVKFRGGPLRRAGRA
jgi:hypothetical protein